MVEDLARDMFRQAISDLDTGDLLGAGGLSVPMEIAGQTGALDLLLTRFDIDPQGLTFSADTGLNLPPDPQVRPSPGTLKTPGVAPGNARMDRISASASPMTLSMDFLGTCGERGPSTWAI